MNLIKYFILQLMLFGVIILTVFYLDSYISKPFTLKDLVAIIIGVVVYIIVLNLNDKAKKRLKPVRLVNKILFSILAILIATIIVGVATGEIKFSS